MRKLLAIILACLLSVFTLINPVAYARPAQTLQVEKSAATIFSLAARTSTATSDTLDLGSAVSLIGLLNVTAISGTNPTLDVKFQDTPDLGATWYDISGLSFTQVTSSTGTQVAVSTRLFTSQVRCVATIAGDVSPSFTFSVAYIATKNAPAIAVSSTDANAANLTSGLLPLARISNLTNTQISASAAIASGKLAEDVARTVTVALSAANIIAMGTTPVELIAAPAAGKIILVESITFKMVRTATAFTGGGAVEFRYTNASGAKVSADVAAALITTGGAGTAYAHVAGIEASITPVAAAAIVITNADAPFADGTGTATVTIKYRIVTP